MLRKSTRRAQEDIFKRASNLLYVEVLLGVLTRVSGVGVAVRIVQNQFSCRRDPRFQVVGIDDDASPAPLDDRGCQVHRWAGKQNRSTH